jgi:hypothetical protein
MQDWVEIEVKDRNQQAITNKKFTLKTSTGQVLKGTLGSNGKARVQNTSPGKVSVEIDLKEI